MTDQATEIILRLKHNVVLLRNENAKLRAALLLIHEHKLPYPGFSTDEGSNGVRDHFIAVAAKALDL